MDGLCLIVHVVGGHSLLGSMRHELGEVLWLEGVEDVEKVLPRRTLILRKLGRKVGAELSILLHLGPKVLNRELVVAGHCDWFVLGLHQQLLLVDEDLLEEVLGHELLRWKVELFCKRVRN